jgi:4-hydroxymandelate oxidase
MTLEEIRENARKIMAPNCRVCPVCDGRACRGEIPGVGAMGDGSSWSACTEFLRRVRLNMDTVYEYRGTDASLTLFGRSFRYPVCVAPIGGMGFNYNTALSNEQYSRAVTQGARRAGTLPFVGGDDPGGKLFGKYLPIVREAEGACVLTLKPFTNEVLLPRLEALRAAGADAVACDIDSAAFANMGKNISLVGPKSTAQLRELTAAGVPFILKGVMTARGAEKAAEAGCAAIVVSSHGGRVLPSAPATCEVLPEIRAAVGRSLTIFVDGGIRSGEDVFKALALGADAVLIGRPCAVAAFGGGEEGVALYLETIGQELLHTMLMCGASSLADITPDMIRI